MQDALDEEHYRQQILVITTLLWLLTVVALTFISPLLIDMSPEGRFAATMLFIATGVSVLISMLVLRFLDNRIIALHMLLLIYTGAFTVACVYFGGTASPTYALLILAPVMAGIAGSTSAGIFWGSLVMLIWFTLLTLERIGVQFQQIILPQNYNVAITVAYAGMSVAVTSIIMAYAQMNKTLRTTLKKANQELGFLSSHDELTGLRNRRFYHEHMGRCLERSTETSRTLGLIVFDLNHFKLINDTYGHGVGDIVLAELGKRLQSQIRGNDLIARTGGDEFAVVLENVSGKNELVRVAEKVAAVVGQPITVRREALAVSASCGVALFPEHGSEQKQLEERADQAMYLAKQSGESVVIAQ